MSFPQLPFCALRTRRISKASSNFSLLLTSSESGVGLVRPASSDVDLQLLSLTSSVVDIKPASSDLAIEYLESRVFATEVKQSVSAFSVSPISSDTAVSAIGDGFDINASAVINAIQATGVTLTTTQKNAINSRIVAAKSDGVWAKWVAYYGFVGGTAAAHAINWKNPSNYLITWNGTLTHDANGVKGNGSSGYGNTSLNALSVFGTGNAGLGFYLTQNKASQESYEIAAYEMSPTRLLEIEIFSNVGYFDVGNNINGSTANTGIKQYFSGNKIGTTSKTYRNGSAVDTQTGIGGTLPSQTLFILARNLGGTVEAGTYSSARLGSVSINTGLTDAEEAANYTSELAFQTTLGRN